MGQNQSERCSKLEICMENEPSLKCNLSVFYIQVVLAS